MSIPPFDQKPDWLKGRGYLHITPKLDIHSKYEELFTKVQDETFVKNHGFFPLIHSVITERRFKKIPGETGRRAHSHAGESTAKQRPLHYSTHIDAMIFSYYAKLLLDQYEEELLKHPGLSDCVIAYRKIEIDNANKNGEKPPGKSTVHFAKEAFAEIERRAQNACIVLMFDIKSFFSELNHDRLKEAWCKLFGVSRLNDAHYNVFNAATDFRYILKDDLRVAGSNGRRKGFDEAKLAAIRKKYGTEAFFESVEDFREAIRSRQLTVYKHPFVKKGKPPSREKHIVGIPQGLPISAVLANLYLLEFDKEILEKVVVGLNGYYRRYSDDILIICKPDQQETVKRLVLSAIEKRDLEISIPKTETYLFKKHQVSPKKNRVVSILLGQSKSVIGKPLTYLGFEFYGTKALIKSANLAKFYRRMLFLIKGKARRAIKISEADGTMKPFIHRNKLKKRYNIRKLDKEKEFTKRKKWLKNPDGTFRFVMKKVPKKHSSNYLSYVDRAASIMENSGIKKQLKKYKKIFNEGIHRHLKKRK